MDHFNEVMPNKRNGGVWRNRLGDFNSTLSLGLVRMLFQGVMDMSDFLSIDKIRQSRWQDILEKLSEYPLGIGEDGRQSLKNMEKGPQDKEVRPSGLNRVSIHGLILPAGVVGPMTDAAFNTILLEDVAHWSESNVTRMIGEIHLIMELKPVIPELYVWGIPRIRFYLI